MSREPLPAWLQCEARWKCKNTRKCRHKATCPLFHALDGASAERPGGEEA